MHPPALAPEESSSAGALHHAEHSDGVDERDAGRPPQVRTDEPQPREMNERTAEQSDEQAVAARRCDAEHANTLDFRARDRKHGHDYEHARDGGKERRRLPGPRHPRDLLHRSPHTRPSAKPLAM